MRTLFLLLFFMAIGVFAQNATTLKDTSNWADSLYASETVPEKTTAPATKAAVVPATTAQPATLNLTELTAKDTAGIETYNKRLSLINDSLASLNEKKRTVQSNVISQFPKQEPKGEFEKQADYDTRMANYDKTIYERTQADSKPINARLAELEKAKSKVEENLSSMYGSVAIKSKPAGASVQINSKDAGVTPLELKSILLPGSVTITITKDGYNPYQTTLQASAGGTLKLDVTLEEKSIFSQADEIDFIKILTKDTDIMGYQSRIQTVNNRKTQINGEVTVMINEIQSVPFKPKDEFEKQTDFDKRQKEYEKTKKFKLDSLKKKYDTYAGKLNRTIEVLNDYIISEQATIKSEAVPLATIELGTYDADKESFELKVQDKSNSNLPFEFQGKVGVPIDTAKNMNRSTEGFAATVSYINYPFGTANIALKELSLTRKNIPLKVEGTFVELSDFTSQAGYAEWKAHTDSILTGKIKPKGLTADYAMGKSSFKSSSGEGLSLKKWGGIVAFAAGVGLGALAIINQVDANQKIDDYNKYNRDNKFPYNPKEAATWTETQKAEYTTWYNNRNDKVKSYQDDINNSESKRNIFGTISAIGFAAGIVAFTF